MSLLDGLKESLKNPLADNNSEMDLVLESDFEYALERAIDARLSPEDIQAILNGDDDIDDDIDDDETDAKIDDKDIKDLEECSRATESTLITISNAADELQADDDIDDIDFNLDPEDDEILSEESLLKLCESLSNDVDDMDIAEEDDDLEEDSDEITDESLIEMLEACCKDCDDDIKLDDTGDPSIPKNSGELSDDIDDLDQETGEFSGPENNDDPAPAGDEEDPGDMTDSDGDETVEGAKTDIPNDDENVKVKEIEESTDEDTDDMSFESILGQLLENPM